MANVLIVVEGETDIVFLVQYIVKIGIAQSGASGYKTDVVLPTSKGKIRLISTAGKDRLKSGEYELKAHIVNAIKDALCEKEKVLVIYDADQDAKGSREYFLDQWKPLFSLDEPEIFLLPNNQDPGELEDLLIACIHPCNTPLLDYWKEFKSGMAPVFAQMELNYEKCMVCSGRENPKEPDLKDIIYSIWDQLTVDPDKKKSRDYSDKKVWDLDSEALEPLRDFLLKNI